MFKVGDKVTYVPLPEGHPEYLSEGGPKGIGTIVRDGNAYPWYVDFPDDEGWPMMEIELQLVGES